MPALTSWIGSARYDGVFFFGSAAIALLMGIGAMIWPALVIVLWWGWLLLLDGPHLLATWSRTMASADVRARWGRLTILSLLWLLPGVLILGASVLLKMPWMFDLFLLGTTVWSIHHNTRQHYGILAIYHARNQVPGRFRRWDRWMVHWGMWAMFGIFVLAHPVNRDIMGLPASWTSAAKVVAVVITALLALSFIAWLGSVVTRRRRGESLVPSAFVLGPVLGSHAVIYGVIGVAEPLMAAPKNAEQMFLVVAVMMGVVHSMQYLGLVMLANQRRGQSPRSSRWDGRPGRWYVICVLCSVVYLLLHAARGTAPGWSFETQETTTTRVFLALYWGVFFHHYFVDQWIWKVSQDNHLREELGL